MSYHDAIMAVMEMGRTYTTREILDAAFPGLSEEQIPHKRKAVNHALTVAERYGFVEAVSRHSHGNTWRRME